jgi:hypothetical protein
MCQLLATLIYVGQLRPHTQITCACHLRCSVTWLRWLLLFLVLDVQGWQFVSPSPRQAGHIVGVQFVKAVRDETNKRRLRCLMLDPWLKGASVPSQPQKAGVDSGGPGSGADDGASRRAYYYDFSIAPEQTLGGAGTLLRRMRERQQQLTSSILGLGSDAATGQGQASNGPGYGGSEDASDSRSAGNGPGTGSREVRSGPGGQAATQTPQGWDQPGGPADQPVMTRSWQTARPQQQQQQQRQQQQQQQQQFAQRGGTGLEDAQARVSDIVEWHHRRMAAALARQPCSPGSGGSGGGAGSRGSSAAATPRSAARDSHGIGRDAVSPQRQDYTPHSGAGSSRSGNRFPGRTPYIGSGSQPLSPGQQAGSALWWCISDEPAVAFLSVCHRA